MIVVALAAAWQVHGRAPLSLDEATRVQGADLRFLLDSASFEGLWQWIAHQDGSMLASVIHGLVLVATDNIMMAAWLPAAGALAISGVAAARLSRSLGSGTREAAVVGLIVWSTPISVRLAGGAFTENFGAFTFVFLLLLLRHLQTKATLAAAALLGVVVAMAFHFSVEYGLTALAMVTVGALASHRLADGRRSFRIRLAAVAAANSLAGISLLVIGLRPASTEAVAFFDPPGPYRPADLLYYLRTPLDNGSFSAAEIGMASVVTAALFLSLGWAVVGWRRRPEWRVPVVAVGVWFVIYSVAGVKRAAFIALIVPVMAALFGSVISDLRRNPDQRAQALRVATAGAALLLVAGWDATLALRLCPLLAALALLALGTDPAWRERALLKTAGTVVAGVIALQAAPQLSNLREQLWFVKPNPPAARALQFVSRYLPSTPERPVLMIGGTGAFSPELLQLTWHQRLGRSSSGVHLVDEAPERDERAALLRAIRRLQPAVIITVRTGPGSRLAPERGPSGQELHPAQRRFARIAAELGEAGLLRSVASLSLENDPLRVDVWAINKAPSAS